MIDRQLGEFGEQEARSRLERALFGAGVRFSGASDKGIDLVVQFEAPTSERQPLYYGVQTKAGRSFGMPARGRWRVQHLDPVRFRQWTRSNIPVLLLWLRPTRETECYWGRVRRGSTPETFSLSKQAHVSPSLRYDLWLESQRDGSEATVSSSRTLRPPLGNALRPFAKEYYRSKLLGHGVMNPLVGKVAFTWRGWRHLTSQGRRPAHIYQSLQMLPAASQLVASASSFLGLRRLSHRERGRWTTEIRLIAMRGPRVSFSDRAAAETVVVVREQITYPRAWLTDLQLHLHVTRQVSFESVYEKVSKAVTR